MPVALVSHSDCGLHDTGWQHVEHVGRLRAIPRALKGHPELYHALVHHEARHALPNELALAHSANYVEAVVRLTQEGGGRVDADTVASAGTFDAATAAAGAVLDAVDMAFDGRAERAFCAVRPPGHHALRATAMGFCFFGSVAVAAHYARSRHAAGRVLIVDWDVHHGNGTQALVEHEPDIRFVSMHQWPWYPGTGAVEDRGPHASVFNVPLPAGLAPRRYVDELSQAIDRATVRWTPDLILLSAGFDCLRGDPLGGFTLECEDVSVLTEELVQRAKAWCDGRLVSALEGGYDPARLGEACMAHLEALL